MSSEKRYGSWYFLGSVILLYIIVILIHPAYLNPSLQFFIGIIKRILPVFIVVFILMVLTNYFVTPRMLVKWLGKESGIKGWLIAIIGGILSSGPIYMWYPLLSQIKKQGGRDGLIATFLYNRAVKIPLMPLLIYYFGWIYAIVLTFVMIIFSVFQGLIVEKIVEVKK